MLLCRSATISEAFAAKKPPTSSQGRDILNNPSLFRRFDRYLEPSEKATQEHVGPFRNIDTLWKSFKTHTKYESNPFSGFASSSTALLNGLERKRISDSQPFRKRTEPEGRGRYVVTSAQALRHLVLDEKVSLKDIDVQLNLREAPVKSNSTYDSADVPCMEQHEVVQLIAQRHREGSKPSKRSHNDTARLALALEGGGMRGAVGAGMAAAIHHLNLLDTFDTIYGSSAGSVIGAYMISRQVYTDVYFEVLTAAERSFLCKRRMIGALAATAVDLLLSKLANSWEVSRHNFPKFSSQMPPGMNLSYVLDSVMDPREGLRPLDMDVFLENNQHQPLRIASSCAGPGGKLYTRCFGTEDFYGIQDISLMENGTCSSDDSRCQADIWTREGIYSYLEASMTVPGATGPPVTILNRLENETHMHFDAFCFEPLPYRSAVEEGATHVLVLCSRPACFNPKTVPGLYERAIAPLYFESHGHPATATFFSRGGQQFIYAEDLLTLEEGKRAGCEGKPVQVPPPQIVYGIDQNSHESDFRLDNDRTRNWKKSFLLPLKVPVGTPELPTTEQRREQVLEAVRQGFAAAYDLLAGPVGAKDYMTDGKLITGRQMAEIIFPYER